MNEYGLKKYTLDADLMDMIRITGGNKHEKFDNHHRYGKEDPQEEKVQTSLFPMENSKSLIDSFMVKH